MMGLLDVAAVFRRIEDDYFLGWEGGWQMKTGVLAPL